MPDMQFATEKLEMPKEAELTEEEIVVLSQSLAGEHDRVTLPKAVAIAASRKMWDYCQNIIKVGKLVFPLIFEVPSNSKKDLTYTVTIYETGLASCTCTGYYYRYDCTHIKTKCIELGLREDFIKKRESNEDNFTEAR